MCCCIAHSEVSSDLSAVRLRRLSGGKEIPSIKPAEEKSVREV